MNYIFSDKKKNILAICFSLFYIVMLFLRIDITRLPFFQNIRYALNSLFIYLTPMITPILVLTLIITYKRDYKFKTWLLPIALGVNLILSVITQISNLASIQVILSLYRMQYMPIYLCSFLMCVVSALMFIGALFASKCIKLLKYGALSYAILNCIILIIDFITLGGFAYIQLVPNGFSAVNISALVRLVSCTLFYIGIFVADFKITNKSAI